MPLRTFFLTLILCASNCYASIAAVFIVTSNADSGPGTLRDAIRRTNENGTAEMDYIQFNIAEGNYKLRIIELDSELPSLSSNVVVDGSTQPGEFYGTTDAKICIRKTTYMPSFSMLRVANAKNIQIYGLHIYYGYWTGLFGTKPARSEILYGIDILHSSDITIGAPGKGNVISGVVHGIYSNSNECSDIKIRSNYLGHSGYDRSGDIDDIMLGSSICITMYNVKDVFIGGSQPAEGNVFGSASCGIYIDVQDPTVKGKIAIQQNLFAYGYDRTSLVNTNGNNNPYVFVGRGYRPIGGFPDGPAAVRVELSDNKISREISIGNISDSLLILRNRFEPDGRTSISKLNIFNSGPGIIGGDDPANANYFLNKRDGLTGPSIRINDGGPIPILKNIFTCNTTWGSTVDVVNVLNVIPIAQVDVATATSVSGRATPNSRVDLYYDDKCSACEGEVYLATVQSNAAGTWTYAGSITGTVIAMATRNNYSGWFSAPTFNTSKLKVMQPVCGLNNGSITGITTEGAETYFWINLRTGDTISKEKDLVNVGPGQYLLHAVHGGTCIQRMSEIFILGDITPVITINPTARQPSCGLANGSITGMYLTATQNSKLEWKNESGQVVSNKIEVSQLPPGKYTFYATDLRSGCSAVSPTYELTNQSGPSLDISDIQITGTTCGTANGSIKGITSAKVTGSPFIQWVNASNQKVGSDYELINVPAGTYRFKFKDQSGCDTIIVSYTVNALTSFDPLTVSDVNLKDEACGLPNGSISINSFNTDPGNFTFRWVDVVSGTFLGNDKTLTGLSAGTYNLFATDKNNCEAKIFTATIKMVPEPKFDYSAVQIKDDECNLKDGSISAVKVNGLTDPATYAWFDENHVQVGGNTSSLQNMMSGSYYLQVTDGSACMIQSKTFIVGTKDRALASPDYADLIIPRYSDITLTLRNPSTGNYKLFTDASATVPSQQNQSGNFTLINIRADLTVYVQHSVGTCNSPLVPVAIKVSDKSYFTIPNAFTPNNDGKNDRLPIKVKGYAELMYFRVYNRWGQIVYETSQLNAAWDGTSKGTGQPSGIYVWVAEGKDMNGQTIKEKGSIILIR